MIDTALRAWITDPASTAVGWAPEPPTDELRCHRDLITRLAEVARPVDGTARVFVAGCPVVHAECGPAIAAASGRSWLAVASGRPAGDLAPRSRFSSGLPAGWVDLEPWAQDVAFARAIDLLRAHVVDALRRVSVD